MFREILENVLEFIGYHDEHRGCKGSELLSFISIDVLPHYGLGQHVTVQQTVMDLLLTETDHFTVKCEGRVVSPGGSINSSLQYEQCFFCPTRALQERTVGYSLRTMVVRAAVNYACENMLFGFLRNQRGKNSTDRDNAASRGVCASLSGLGGGVRTLVRDKWLRSVFVFDKCNNALELCLLPYFAMPAPPQQQQLQPFQSYLKRCRARVRESRLLMDVNVLRHIVLSSPGQRLVYQDALHALFDAYGETVPSNSKRFGRYAPRLFRIAGLRVARVCVTVGRRTRLVSVVVDARAAVSVDWRGREGPSCEEEEDRDDGNISRSLSTSGSEDLNLVDDKEEVLNGGEGSRKGIGKTPSVNVCGNGGGSFYVDPAFPFTLQVVKEAERHPLTVESALPRVVFHNFAQLCKDLHRYITVYEENHETIDITNVLSSYSKSFTRLLQPKGWSSRHKSDHGELYDLSLPKGVTRWSLGVLLDALKASPTRAMVLAEFDGIVDRRTLGRIIPVLQRENRITTIGIDLPQGKRIGAVVLAGVTLTAADTEELVRRYREKVGPRLRWRGSVMRLEDVQSLGGDECGSAGSVAKFIERSPGVTRVVTKITMIRNGYSRVGVFRHSRLHLELCRVWHLFQQKPCEPLTLGSFLQEMSLSSFCIVVGVGSVDLSLYTNDGNCRWGTSMGRLPPTLQQHCRSSGLQPLIYSLSILQEKGLVLCDRALKATEDLDPDELWISLSKSSSRICNDCSAVDIDDQLHEQREFVFFPNDECVDPQETCRVVMQYWQESWQEALSSKPTRGRLSAFIREAVAVEPNMTNVQIFALSWLARVDCGIVAEHVLQRLGCLTPQKGTRPRECRGWRRVLSRCIVDDEAHIASAHPGSRRRIDLSVKNVVDVIINGLQCGELKDTLTRLQLRLLAQGTGLLEGHYSPHSNRIRDSMLAIVQNMLKVVPQQRASVSGNGRLLQANNAVASFVLPNFMAPGALRYPDGGPIEESVGSERLPQDLRQSPFGPSCGFTSATRLREEPPEKLQDIIRMILLSDEAHYDAVAAEHLLAQFTEKEVDNCVDWLLTFPSFRNCSGGSGRLRRIELSPSCKLLHVRHTEQVTHPRCASASFAHAVAVSMLFLPQSNCYRWCTPPALLSDTLPLKDVPRLIRQPFPDTHSLWNHTQESTELSALRLPRFTFPPRSVDKKRAAAWETVAGTVPTASNTATTIPIVGCTSGSCPKSAPEPYPARFLLRPWKRLRYLDLPDIPVDAPPTADQSARARAALVRPAEEGSGDVPTAPRYPSVFHHVSGSFHEFFWRSFLFSVYALVHKWPGITEEGIIQELMPSGLASRTACRIAIGFLKASLVITERVVLQKCGDVPSPFEDGLSRTVGEGRAKVVMRHAVCYFCTLSQNGPWNVVDM